MALFMILNHHTFARYPNLYHESLSFPRYRAYRYTDTTFAYRALIVSQHAFVCTPRPDSLFTPRYTFLVPPACLVFVSLLFVFLVISFARRCFVPSTHRVSRVTLNFGYRFCALMWRKVRRATCTTIATGRSRLSKCSIQLLDHITRYNTCVLTTGFILQLYAFGSSG